VVKVVVKMVVVVKNRSRRLLVTGLGEVRWGCSWMVSVDGVVDAWSGR